MNQGISLETVEGLASEKGVIVRFINETNSQWQFRQKFWVEKRSGDMWHELPTMRLRSFDALACLIAPKSSCEEVFVRGWLREPDERYIVYRD